ncbi:MAG: GGDEF domain-containing protein [Treponema sp.]|jgi:diguanylate cyclase (GGDEF)-like protein|nr:GGDEF domain-containing protein [Treponema sp.]
MLTKLRKNFIANLLKYPFQQKDELSLYLIAHASLIFCVPIHVFFLIIYLFKGLPLFVYLNCGSLTVYLMAFLLLRAKQYRVVGALVSLEATLYALVWTLLCGISSYIMGYFLLVIVMQLLYPYGTVRLRRIIVLILFLIIIGLVVHAQYTAPFLVFSEDFNFFMTLVNLFITMVGAIIEVSINSWVQRIVFEVKEGRLAELASQIYTDPLTRLYNRRYTEIYFNTLKAEDQQICVAILDIDDFKRINDTYGHPCGDDILIFLAVFLQNNLRKTDRIFRWGGEEFLIIMENVILSQAQVVMDKLRSKLAETEIITKQHKVFITITVGVAPFELTNPEAGIEASDKNLYIGKRNGKNQVVI